MGRVGVGKSGEGWGRNVISRGEVRGLQVGETKKERETGQGQTRKSVTEKEMKNGGENGEWKEREKKSGKRLGNNEQGSPWHIMDRV